MDFTYAVQVFDTDAVGEALIGGLMVTTDSFGEVCRQIREKFAGRHYYYNCQRL